LGIIVYVGNLTIFFITMKTLVKWNALLAIAFAQYVMDP